MAGEQDTSGTTILDPPIAGDDALADHGFLVDLGRRLRALRKSDGLSRRALAERSGLSQRFIAQLEAGAGNISVLRLKRLCDALGADMAVVLGGGGAAKADALAVRIRAAPVAIRDRIAELLASGTASGPDPAQGGRIALIGLRGAGKSTLGRMAADRLGLDFVELNTEIERDYGLAIGEIFSLYGEVGYRRLEREQLIGIAARDHLILAVAGGIVDGKDTYKFLLENFATVWLQASPDEHMARVAAQGDQRPMAGNAHAMDDLHRILEARKSHYARADAVLDTSGATVEASAAALADLLRRRFLPA